MNRGKKLAFNSISSLIYQLIAIICGFILPRMYLTVYGSAVNGLITSVTQFLGFISLCELGVGAVVQSALYKPLAENDTVGVSKIAISSERFFRGIAYILLAYTALLMVLYPLKTIDSFGYGYTLLLILVMSVSTFAQYYFGMTYRLILSADQLGFIHYTVHSITLVLNTVCCIILMHLNASIHVVKLATSIIFLLQPICISLIARRRYHIDRKIVLSEEPIKQKWNGLTQHIATVVLGNTGTIVLTLMSTLENVSIYGVYHLVVNGVKQIVLSLTNGIQAMMGNMLVKNERKTLDRTFEFFEWIIHTGVTAVFAITAFLIVPFVSVYTKGVTDVNYIVPTFAYLITLAQAAYCLRLPYNIMVLAAGHYKETQWSAIIEAGINIVISVLAVNSWGLIGVAIGTIAAMLYRTVYLAWYLRSNVINRKFAYYLRHMAVNILTVAVFFAIVSLLPSFYSLREQTYLAWCILAIKTGVTCLIVTVLVNLLCYRSLMMKMFSAVKNRIKK
ncbi:MAG: sugar isomerase [Ruminococcaceae bacterium]|nr:sugar isomerase [Oscillospiraceae bacterium]